jgi:hypothetical protein
MIFFFSLDNDAAFRFKEPKPEGGIFFLDK